MTPKELLTAAANAFESGELPWTQGCAARDKYGIRCKEDNPNAVSFCMVGALRKLEPNFWTRTDAYDAIRKVIGMHPSSFNDTVGREVYTVVWALRKAAASLS